MSQLVWYKRTLGKSLFSAASTQKTLNILTIPKGCVVHAVKVDHGTAFAGPSVSAAVLHAQLSTDGSTAFSEFCNRDVLASVGSAAPTTNGGTPISQSQSAATYVLAQLVLTGANTSVLTAGKVTVWVLLSDPG